jgi:rubrerythrin
MQFKRSEMAFNPLGERGIPLDKQLRNWAELNVQPYDKDKVHPYSRCRGIVANGIEVEAVMFSHQLARNTLDPALKQQIAQVRRIEAQQQKATNWLIPGNETTLEVTIGYEQVAVDLTSWVAQNEPDPYLRQVYEFGLLEDFDHLYRYANLYDLSRGKNAAKLVGDLTEITPGRPTIFEHRDPRDDLRRPMTALAADPQSILNALTVLSAEQQTMNFYLTIGNRFIEPIARGLYLEIAEIEEQHVSHYESILDPGSTWLENLVFHEYNECWIYYSFMQDEPDPRVRAIYELHLNMEIEHLRLACEMMRKVERRDPELILPKAIDRSLIFKENKAYVRQVLEDQVNLTADGSDFVLVSELDPDHRYFAYQQRVNGDWVPSEEIIAETRAKRKRDYRLEIDGPNPVPGLRREDQRNGQSTDYAKAAKAA